MPGSSARASRNGASSISRWMNAEPLGVEVLDRRHVLDAGVVDEDVGVHVGAQAERVDRRTVGEVGDQVVAADVGGDLLGAGLVAVQHEDVRAVRGEPARRRRGRCRWPRR